MNVNFSDSFFDSLNKLARYDAWYNKLWRAITKDIWHFFKNIWRFRKELWSHRWWDYTFTLMILKRSITIMEEGMHKGLEIRETRDKKIEKMQRAIQILNNITESKYIEMAEVELGELVNRPWEFEPVSETSDSYRIVDNLLPDEEDHNGKVFDRASELEELEWKELWVIFQGQDYHKFNKDADWDKQFDGTGLRGWWD
jgi:hypothetical protein